MTLRDDVHQLVNPHMTMRYGKTWVMPPLLTLLDHAITEKRTGAQPGGETSIPISAGALAIQSEISEECMRLEREYEGAQYGTVETVVRRWAEFREDDAKLAEATGRWVKLITDLVDPAKPQRRLTLPCPACGVLFMDSGKAALQVNCYDAEGRMTHIGTWTAECTSCEAGWPPEQMPWLIRAITAQEER